MENPFTHVGNQGTGYVTSEAERAASPATNAELVPTQLAIALVGAAAGLWLLKRAGFRFVGTAGVKGGI